MSADQDIKEDRGVDRTPLHWAAHGGNVAVVAALVAGQPEGALRSAYVNQRDESGRSALEIAVAGGHLAVVRCLLDRPDGNAAAHTDMPAQLLRLAVQSDNTEQAEIVEAVLEATPTAERESRAFQTAGDDAMRDAAGRGRACVVERLISAGLKVDGADTAGETALMAASRQGHLDIAKQLVAAVEGAERTAFLNARRADSECSALAQATAAGHVTLVRWLLEEGAELGCRVTLLLAAVGSEDPVVVETVLAAIPAAERTESVNGSLGGVKGGETPLQAASRRGSAALVRALEEWAS